MQQIKILTAALIFVIAAVSCKKERVEEPTPAPSIQKRIVEEKNITNGDYKKYSYDEQGRVSKVETESYFSGIEYLSSKIKITRKRNSDNALLGTEEYSTDASGRMTSVILRSANGTVTYSTEFEYDADGYMIRMKETSSSGKVVENIVINPAGNPVTIKYYENGGLDDVTDYYYNADVQNIGTGTPLLGYYGIKGFAGRIAEREVSEFKRYSASGVLTMHRINTFITDTDRRILKYTSSYPVSGHTHNWDVTYQ